MSAPSEERSQVRILSSEAILKERVSMISNTLLIPSGERLILVGLINHYQWKSGGLRQTDSSAYREVRSLEVRSLPAKKMVRESV